MNNASLRLRSLQPAALLLAALFLATPAYPAEESCTTCSGAVAVNGDFAHHKVESAPAVAGTGFKPEAYRESVHGTAFTVTISNLPAGRYTVDIGTVETYAKAAG